MPVIIGNYKGHPTITLLRNPDDTRGFTFGIEKAKLVVQNIDAIKTFAANAVTTDQDAEA